MKKLIMIASAAAMAMTMPALAQGQGKGKGASQKGQQATSIKRNAKANGQARTNEIGRTDARSKLRARTRTGSSVDRMSDPNRNGIPDFRERAVDRNRDGVDDRAQNQFGGQFCPPGLAKKTPACIPPGQAKRMFNEGQRLPTNFRDLTDFNDLSPEFRDRLPSEFRSDNFDFLVRDNSIFVVDPTTRVVRSIIDLLRR